MGGLTMSTRRFQVWEYTVSHAQLLLRSVRDEIHPTRVDVLFKNVGYMALPSAFMVDVIEELSGDQLETLEGLAAGALSDGRTAFRLTTAGGDGLAVAGVMVSAEDELESHEPSALPCWPMRSGPAD
jgi:hypothetical protein